MGTHTFHLLIVERTIQTPPKTTMKSFAVILAAVAAAAQGQVLHHAAGLPFAGYHGLPAALPAGYAGLPAALPAAGYAGLHAGLHYAPAQPLAYAAAPAAVAAPLPAPAVIPAVPKTYAVPPARIVEEPAIVETINTPVEQHGYKIKY